LSVMSLYLPSGTNAERLGHHVYGWFSKLYYWIEERDSNLVNGDYNICHEAIDIHDPIRNKKTSGFARRKSLVRCVSKNGFVDTFWIKNQILHLVDNAFSIAD
jgi:exodeoxyribonuclease-3